MLRIVWQRHDRFIRPTKSPLCNNVIKWESLARCGLQAYFYMISIKPIICIKKADPIVLFGNCNERAHATRSVAKIRMTAVKLDVPNTLVVYPRLRMAVRNKEMIGWRRLIFDTINAPPEKIFVFPVIGRNDCVSRLHRN